MQASSLPPPPSPPPDDETRNFPMGCMLLILAFAAGLILGVNLEIP